MSENTPMPLVEVSAKDLPVYCPNPQMARWSSHPRVFIDVNPRRSALPVLRHALQAARRRSHQRSSLSLRRALVIAPNWIGDALMAQPLFTLLKRLNPRLTIDALAPAWVAPVLERMPEIGTVHSSALAHGKLQLLNRWQLAGDLREHRYDAAYVLPNSFKSALIPWMAGIRLRIGYTGELRHGLLNVRHANPRKDARAADGAPLCGARLCTRRDPARSVAAAAHRVGSQRGRARIEPLHAR